MAVDGGSGEPTVELTADEQALVIAMAARTASDATSDPLTGAEMGMSAEVAKAALASPMLKA